MRRERTFTPARIRAKFVPHAGNRRGLTLVEMSIVIVVIMITLLMLGSIASNFTFLKTSTDEAEILRDSLVFCRSSAIKSNQTSYLEIDLDQESYRAYRFMRTDGKLVEKDFLSKRTLSGFNSLASVAVATGKRITSGKITVPFSPEGVAEELAIYIGDEGNIKATVIFSRYGQEALVKKGEFEHNLENTGWKEDLEGVSTESSSEGLTE